MDETRASWTQRIDDPRPAVRQSPGDHADVPSANIPTTIHAGDPRADVVGSSVDASMKSLERTVRRSRVMVGVLTGAFVVLTIAVIALSMTVLARVDTLVNSIAAMEKGTASSVTSSATGAASTSTGDVSDEDGADDSADGDTAHGVKSETAEEGVSASYTASDLTILINKTWSNALRILETYGIDPADLAIITDDGGRVFEPRNWTVTMVVDLGDTGQVAVYLRHDTSWLW